MRYLVLGFCLFMGQVLFGQKYTATETVVFPDVLRKEHIIITELTQIILTPKETTIISGKDTMLLRILGPFSRREEGDCFLQTFRAVSGEYKFIVGFSYQGKTFLNLGLLDSSNRLLLFIVNLKTNSL